MRRKLAALVALALVLLAGAVLAEEAPWTIDSLMADLRGVRRIEAEFREEKEFRALSDRLVSVGRMTYHAPADLAIILEEPSFASYHFQGDWLTLNTAESGVERMPVSRHAAVRMFAETILATLSGDLATLRSHYHLELEGVRDDWTLRLAPLDPAVASQVEAIVIRGRGETARSVEQTRTDGDRVLTTFTPTLIQ